MGEAQDLGPQRRAYEEVKLIAEPIEQWADGCNVPLSLRLHQQAQHAESLQPKGAGAGVGLAFVYQE